MGSQGLKLDPQKPRSPVLIGLAVALVIAGSMLFAGTVQLRAMRTEFAEMDKMLSMLKRQTLEMQEEKQGVEQRHSGELQSLERKLVEKEREIEASVELMGEKKAKLKEMEGVLSEKQAELDEKEQMLTAKQSQVETNKNAAKKLALVLAQTQADKERLKTETAALIKPEIDKCNEAMAAKDAAISALVSEREKADSDIARSDRDAAKAKGELNSLQQQLDKKTMELDQLKAWKGEATKEFKQQAERSKHIWTASVTEREKAQPRQTHDSRLSTPIAFPPSAVRGGQGLGEHLQTISRSSGVELGGIGPNSIANLTAPLLQSWMSAMSYSIIDTQESGESVEEWKSAMRDVDRRIRYLRMGSVEEAIGELSDESLDFIHVGEYKESKEENEALLAACWNKLREGGALAGGFGNPSERHPGMRSAVVAFAQGKLRQPLFGLDRKTPALWLLRK